MLMPPTATVLPGFQSMASLAAAHPLAPAPLLALGQPALGLHGQPHHATRRLGPIHPWQRVPDAMFMSSPGARLSACACLPARVCALKGRLRQ